MFGRELTVGDVVAYGKSNRDNPINVGVIVNLYYKGKDDIEIIGFNNKRPGILPYWESDRRIVLLPPEYIKFLDYKEGINE